MKRALLAGVGLFALAIAQPSIAADLPTKAPAYMAPVAAPVFNWTGFYGGVNGGWADYRTYPSGTRDLPSGTFVQPSGDGWTAGGHLGVNWQTGSWVWGIEADANWLGLSASAPCGTPIFTCGTSLDWQASVRGRLGPALDRLFVYVTGGVAFTELDGFAAVFRDSKRRSGWIVGIGADWAVTNNWIMGIEYLYADFGKKDQIYDAPYPDVPVKTQQVRVRLSYLFATGKAPSPVVTRY